MKTFPQILSANLFLLKKNTVILRRSSGALGDNLMLSFLAKEIKRHNPEIRVAIETAIPDLFINNPHIEKVYTDKVAAKYYKLQYKIEKQTKNHILDQIAVTYSPALQDVERHVHLFLSESEVSYAKKNFPEKYIVMGVEGKQSFASNRKEWGLDRFQELCDSFSNYNIIQTGGKSDTLLDNVTDARGMSLRETGALIFNSLTGIFLEGGLMHLANAVNRESVIIFGGALDPEITGYDNNINISTSPKCSPCFTSHQPMDRCETMICMKEISVDRVANAVRQLIKSRENNAN